MNDLLAALCLVLVIEGLLPLISPGGWRRLAREASELDEKTIRRVAFVCIVVGLVLLRVVRSASGSE